MFEYCVEALHMSEAEAYLRIRSARLCQAHNQLLAERDHGRSFIKQRIAQAKQQRAMRQLAPETPEPAERVTQRP